MKAYWKNNHFMARWKEMPKQVIWCGEWKDFQLTRPNTALRYLVLWHHKTKNGDAGNIKVPEKLEYLELNWSNAKCISELPKSLKRLEIHYSFKLTSVRGLAKRCPDLRYLHIQMSKHFDDLKGLLQLKNLEVLCLNSCGTLPSLKFLDQFPNLRDFRFVNTNILDGDLSPLIKLPKLKYVGMLDKKHYNLTAREIEAVIYARLKPSERKTFSLRYEQTAKPKSR